jgi:putative nucleotidyltransferase with HDIG domain
MKISSTFLHSKVARRIFFLFVLCALFPIAIVAVFSMREVTQQLTQESEARLLQATRSEGMSTYERLTLLEAEMKVLASGIPRASAASSPAAAASALPAELNDRFLGIAVVTGSGTASTLFGTLSEPPQLTPAEAAWVQAGNTALSVQRGPETSRIFMTRMLDPEHPERGRLLAEVNPDYVWGVAALPVHTEFCVFDAEFHPIFCSAGNLLKSVGRSDPSAADFLPATFKTRKNDPYVIRHWEIFLKPRFGISKWVVVLGERRSEVLALLAPFAGTFPYVILLSIWFVTLLSLIQIRRSLVPLERLKEATQRMSGLNFGTPVSIKSNDEFQDLAHSFNDMADRLSRQFQALESINQIDRAILSSLDTEKIVRTVLGRLGRIVPLECVSISLADPKDPLAWKTYLACAGGETQTGSFAVSISEEEFAELRQNPEVMLLSGAARTPSYLERMAVRGMNSFLVLPLMLQGKVRGIIAMGRPSAMALSDEHIFQSRQVADQVAVALSNASLIQQLADLHIGTLTALARTIDAKSAWTAGHSERVTAFALRIGKAMGLSQRELDNLYRGGLLHDIGKIGIPPGILDKPGKLTPEEIQLMREHVRIGARILEPIPGFQEIIPIVLQHHEWFDGTGYPDGVAGENIHLNARIFALADCYDALTSDRPYRPGLGHEQVMEMIRKETGTHFDPAVVKAFYRMMTAEKFSPAETEAATPVGVVADGSPLS